MISPLPEAQWGFDTTLTGYRVSTRRKAKQLLAEAGVKPGLKVELLDLQQPARLQPGRPRPGGGVAGLSAEGRHRGRRAQARHGRVPRHGALRAISGAVHHRLQRRQRRPRQFRRVRCSTRGRCRSATPSHYKNPEVDKLMDQAAREADHDKRVALYKTLQRQIMDDAPWVFVNSVLQVRAAPQGGEGLPAQPDADVLRHGPGVDREIGYA